MRIWKYPLAITDEQFIEVPYDAKVLSVIIQGNYPVLYCLVNPDYERRFKRIRIVGTGHPIPDDRHLSFINTVKDAYLDDQLIWHIFEDIRTYLFCDNCGYYISTGNIHYCKEE